MTDTEHSPHDLKEGERLFNQPWHFVKGVVALEHLPEAGRPEIAVAGRSNAGKSTLINALVRHNGLARSSNTPGRTQEINYFSPACQSFYLVDLPGYGFAKAPKEKVDAWNNLIRGYLAGRPNLARTLVLVDSRHGIKPPDREIMAMLDTCAVAYQVVLTKADKISAKALKLVVEKTASELRTHPAAFPVVHATSALKNQGFEELRASLARLIREHTATTRG